MLRELVIVVAKVAMPAVELAKRVLLLDVLAHVHQTAPVTLFIVAIHDAPRLGLRGQIFLRVGPLTTSLWQDLL